MSRRMPCGFTQVVAANDRCEVAEVAANDWYKVTEVVANDWYKVANG
ncbi:hypothetical protein Tco_1464496, partial [Tanacetum coccineum]